MEKVQLLTDNAAKQSDIIKLKEEMQRVELQKKKDEMAYHSKIVKEAYSRYKKRAEAINAAAGKIIVRSKPRISSFQLTELEKQYGIILNEEDVAVKSDTLAIQPYKEESISNTNNDGNSETKITGQ